MGPTWGPHGSCRPHVGPMLAPWTLLSRKPCKFSLGYNWCLFKSAIPWATFPGCVCRVIDGTMARINTCMTGSCFLNPLTTGRCGNSFKSEHFMQMKLLGICELAIRWMWQSPFFDKFTWFQVMAWCPCDYRYENYSSCHWKCQPLALAIVEV